MLDIKGVIFDLDGTLIDSMQVWKVFEYEYLRSLGAEPRPGLGEVLRSLSSVEEAVYFREEYGVTQSVEEIVLGRNSLISIKYKTEIPVKAGVMQALMALKARGIRMCIATATERELVEPAIERLGFMDYVERVFTCEEVGVSKSSPDIYILAAEYLGLDPGDILVAEDALYAMKTAKKAGFVVAGVYDLSSADQEEEIKQTCDYYWQTLDEMLVLLK